MQMHNYMRKQIIMRNQMRMQNIQTIINGRWAAELWTMGGLLGLKKQKFVFLSLALFGVSPGGRHDHTKRFIPHSEFLSGRTKLTMGSRVRKGYCRISVKNLL